MAGLKCWTGFDKWLEDVDQILLDNFGMTHDDFEDWGWNRAFQAGKRPAEAYRAWYKEATKYM